MALPTQRQPRPLLGPSVRASLSALLATLVAVTGVAVTAQPAGAAAGPAVIATIPMPGAPKGVAVTPDGTRLLVADSQNNRLLIFSAITYEQISEAPLINAGPAAVVVDPAGDFAYVTGSSDNRLYRVDLANLATTFITVGQFPEGLAISPDGSRLVVSNFNSNNVSVVTADPFAVAATVSVGANPGYSGFSPDGSYAYVPNSAANTISVIDMSTNLVSNTLNTSVFPYQVALSPDGASLYYTQGSGGNFYKIDAQTDTELSVLPGFWNLAAFVLDPTGSFAYLADFGNNSVETVDLQTMVPVGSSLTVGGLPLYIAISPSGERLYSSNYTGLSVSVIATSGNRFVTFLPNGGTGVMGQQIASTPTALTTNAFSRSGYTFTGWNTAANGSGASYANQATYAFNDDTILYAQWAAIPPPPPPVFPPSAPLNITATPGDASVTLTWGQPNSSGTFPVTSYQAVVSPGGQACLVTAPTLTCTISGLTNGTTYTATVRALNGAGWSPNSAPSAAFTPQAPPPPPTPTITISGTRGDVNGRPGVTVDGTTADLDMGAVLRPWVRFPGQPAYTQGTSRILVSQDGTFTWQRRTGKRIYIIIKTENGSLSSNRLVIQAR